MSDKAEIGRCVDATDGELLVEVDRGSVPRDVVIPDPEDALDYEGLVEEEEEIQLMVEGKNIRRTIVHESLLHWGQIKTPNYR